MTNCKKESRTTHPSVANNYSSSSLYSVFDALQANGSPFIRPFSSTSTDFAEPDNSTERNVLNECVFDPSEITNDNLPFMGVLQTKLKDGTPCRVVRISFSGELAYEMYIESDYANGMMDT